MIQRRYNIAHVARIALSKDNRSSSSGSVKLGLSGERESNIKAFNQNNLQPFTITVTVKQRACAENSRYRRDVSIMIEQLSNTS